MAATALEAASDVLAKASAAKAPLTAFLPSDAAVKALLSQVGRYGGVLLLNDTFTGPTMAHLIVPGRAWTVAQLAAAAPVTLKTLAGYELRVTADPAAPCGLRVAGAPLARCDCSASTGAPAAALCPLGGLPLPAALERDVKAWSDRARQRPAAEPAAAAAAGGGGGAAAAMQQRGPGSSLRGAATLLYSVEPAALAPADGGGGQGGAGAGNKTNPKVPPLAVAGAAAGVVALVVAALL